ncbi:conserved protein of unknown function [Candidatus Nitrospira inopinata]|uniref:DUF58 domain-containing protein n=1 Tax=Candidatus Nitrospira inopinata TaxID=1715989 RepID=A0A0S4KRB4_9BACT|nr:conserved protein of unknown function [Candidatus Nitrospira inopinata]
MGMPLVVKKDGNVSGRSRSILRRLALRRSTRVTSEGALFLFLALAVGVAAVNTGNNLFYLLLSMMLSGVLVSGVAARSCLNRLEIRRHVPDLLFVNEPATAALVIKNGKRRWSSYALRLCDVTADGHGLDRGLAVHHLPPGAGRLLSYPLVPSKRGSLKLDEVSVSTSFPFGLFYKTACYSIPATVPVSPAIKPLPNGLLRELSGPGQERTVHRKGYGSDLYNLRLYQPGDDSRTIHWLTTARTSKLIVRETEAESHRRATIYLSLLAPDSHDAVFEEAVSLTASLLHHLTGLGYWLRLMVGSCCSSFGHGDAHLVELLRALAFCERRAPGEETLVFTDHSRSPDEWGRGAMIVVRSWRQAPVPITSDEISLIDMETMGGGGHVS